MFSNSGKILVTKCCQFNRLLRINGRHKSQAMVADSAPIHAFITHQNHSILNNRFRNNLSYNFRHLHNSCYYKSPKNFIRNNKNLENSDNALK